MPAPPGGVTPMPAAGLQGPGGPGAPPTLGGWGGGAPLSAVQNLFVPKGVFQGGPSNTNMSPVPMDSTAGKVLSKVLPLLPGAGNAFNPSQPSEPPRTEKERAEYEEANKYNAGERMRERVRQDLVFNQPVPGQNDVTDDSGQPITTTTPAHVEPTADPLEREGLREANTKSVEGVEKQANAVEDLGAAAAEKSR